MEKASLIFITGGVRSGKSRFAEDLAIQNAALTGGNLHYLAPGVASDPEMKKRIEKHKRERQQSKVEWTTWEQPRDIGELSGCFNSNDILVLDCLTTLLNNELFFNEEKWDRVFLREIHNMILTGITSLLAQSQQLIIVSNEVLQDFSQGNELVWEYSRIIGQLHQDIVNLAEQAYLVECGVPMMMKGDKE
ncbi:bifunctional adenosylcobinamide kinase/adenosylcobinamide-phosphate guanylyltransferase [Bacillus dakarensis]|uniref:bifunctional adenosylcobinamide kinase/adenosylcobinamide-phosphate guanylyltransferase n=1 Tax=Robertmurraya dakarensis TaxID=1926278 RepID=UPI0009809DAD|nr:bifunctional adenosylcobinamide kinase/adenosylcobinamide-phosphate guanylyltransferase [Bacillus dakarensis]